MRYFKDKLGSRTFLLISTIPLLLVLSIFIALFLRTLPILQTNPLGELLTGRVWKPTQGAFGFYPFIIGTMWVTGVALVLAVPPCILTALYLSEYAHAAITGIMKPVIDLLAGIPSVVFGIWGVIVIVPFVREVMAPMLGRLSDVLPILDASNPTGYSILAGGVVLAVMIVPVIIAVSYEVLKAVPEGAREASLVVGATKWQTIKYAVFPQALPGIFAAVVLGLSRALGETMAVLMVVGNVAQIPKSIFDSAYPLTALIANNYGEMLSIPLYDSALMGAALVLLLVVLLFNLFSALILQRFIRGLQV